MKQKLLNSLRLRVCALVAFVLCAVSGAWADETTTYTFSSKSWAANISGTQANWTSGTDGNQFTSGRGIQVTTGASGANGTSPSSFSNVSQIVVTYSTNASNGAGSIAVQVGNNTAKTNTITKTGGTTDRTTVFTYDPSESGNVKITVNCTTNSIYIKSVAITYSSGDPSLIANDLSLNKSEYSFDLANGDNQTFQLTNSGSADGALSFVSSNTSVATVSNLGLITAIGEGTATITVTQAASSTYQGGSATCAVTVSDSRYTVSTLTFTSACGGTGTTKLDDNDATSNSVTWTVSSDGEESSFDSDRGIHYGTGSKKVQYITLSTSDINGTIKKVVVNASTASGVSATVDVKVGGSAFAGSAQSLSTSATDYTFNASGTAKGQILVTVTKESSSTGALYVKSVKVYYEPSTDPAIDASDVNIAYDANNGSIAYTLENATGNISAVVTTGDWLTLGTITSSAVPFTCSANTGAERTATVTLSFSDAEDKVVTVTQAAAPYTTIPALFEAATSTAANVNVTFGNWVVSGVSGSNVFVTDNNGNGFIIYTSSHGFAVNDKLSGTVMETPLKKYNGSAEFTNLTSSTTGLTVSNDGVVTVITNKTIADLGGVNTGAVITLSNLTYDGTNLSDGTNTIKPYTTLYSEMSLTSGKTYNVTGVYQQYGNNTKEILPRSAADIVEVQVQHNEYTLTVSNLSHVDLYVFDASDETNPIISGEGSAQVLDGTQVMVSVDVESGYVIESLIVDGNDVTSQIDDTDAYTFTMPTHAVTIYATVEQGISYTLATSITSGKHYVIAATTNSGTKAMGGKNASKAYYDAIDASLSGSTLSVTESSGVQEFVIYGPNADGYYSIYDPVANGYLCATSSSSNDLSYKANNDEEGLWEIDFDNQTVTAQGSYTRNMLQYNSSQPRFSCYASTTQHSVSFYEKSGEATPTESKTLNGSGYATYCSQNALDFSAATGGTAWTVSAIDNTDNTITFTQITGKAAAGTGMLLKGDANGTITMTAANGKDDLGTNLLVGTTAATDVTAGEYYGLSGATFVKVNAGTVPAGKALLDASNINENVGGNNAKVFTFVFEGADGIKTVEHVSAEQAAEIFNLAGQRMSKPVKGVNIINGKKVLVK